MQRLIKFRGFGVWSDCKQWWYGDISHYTDGKVEIVEKRNNIRSFNYEVDPKSVGEFTGLLDKNGKEIYEGDILKYDLIDGAKGNIPDEGVEFINGKFGVWHYDFCGFDEIENYEVIGNVYSNPELLTSPNQ